MTAINKFLTWCFYQATTWSLFGLLVLLEKPSLAQSKIIPDNTLGTENSTVVTNFKNLPIEVITGGATRGINLFHSFQEFNVSKGRSAYFLSPSVDIQNIFARVTGSNRSEILGRFGTFGDSTPNLFLINPNGIIFGKNASLDLQGSFAATTANAIQFGERGNFSATNPEVPQLLTINPSAFLFSQINQTASIQNNSVAPAGKDLAGVNAFGLRVPDGKSLLLVGGNVSMDGGQLNAYGGRVGLGGLAAPGNINLISDGNNLRLGFPENLTRADVSFTNQATVYVEGAGGGDIAINARNIEILGGSLLLAGIAQGLGTHETKAGDITLNATEQVKVEQESQIRNDVFPNATGRGGDLTITTRDLLVRDGANIGADTFAASKGGNLTVNASNTQLIGTSTDGSTRSGLYTFADRGSTGDVGNLTINTQDFLARDGAEVSTSTLGAGKAGNLTINATGSVQVIGRSADGQLASGLFASANLGSTGDAGNLTIITKDLLVRDGAEVIVSTFSNGKGGDLIVNASNSIKLSGTSADGSFSSGLFAEATLNSTGNAAVGKAGNLTITTKDLLVDNGAEVSASTFGSGQGGDLTINVQNLLVQNGATVTAGTLGAGKGGNLIVNASNNVYLIGTSADGNSATGLGTPASQGSTGDAGDLTITARDVFVRDGARVTADTLGAGKGGNLTVNASNSIQLIGTSADGYFLSAFSTTTQPGSTGNAGNLTINTQDLLVRDGAQVGTGTFSRGKGGSLTVNASNSVKVIGGSGDNPSGFFSSAQPGSTGDGGNLTINTQDLLVSKGQVSTGTFGTGKGGNLIINTNYIQLIGRIATVNNIAPSGLVASAQPGSTGNAGDLTITTQDLMVSDGAGVRVDSQGTGNAGIMTIKADRLSLDNNATINANTRSPNKDPNREQATINIRSQDLTLRHNSKITTNATGENVIGGNINIDADLLLALENSRISANSDNSRGGQVRINAKSVFVGTQPSDVSEYITATSGVGLSGSVNVNSPDNSTIQNSLTELPTNAIDTNALIANSCIVRTRKQKGTFNITGTGGLPYRPGDAVLSSYPTGTVRSIPSRTSRPWKKGDPIVEPTGVYRLPNGQLVMSRECQNNS